MRWRGLVAIGRLAGRQSLEEGDDVDGGDRGEVDVALIKTEVEEPVGEALAVTDGAFAQATLAAEMVFVVMAQARAQACGLVVHVVAPSGLKELRLVHSRCAVAAEGAVGPGASCRFRPLSGRMEMSRERLVMVHSDRFTRRR